MRQTSNVEKVPFWPEYYKWLAKTYSAGEPTDDDEWKRVMDSDCGHDYAMDTWPTTNCSEEELEDVVISPYDPDATMSNSSEETS